MGRPHWAHPHHAGTGHAPHWPQLKDPRQPPFLGPPISHIPERLCPLTSPFQTPWLLQEAESLSQDTLGRGASLPGAGPTAEGILDSDGGWALNPLGLLLGPKGFKTEEKPTEIKSKGPERSWEKARNPTTCHRSPHPAQPRLAEATQTPLMTQLEETHPSVSSN